MAPIEAPLQTNVLGKLIGASPTAGKWIVGERGVRPDEHVIVESHAVPQLYPALDRHPVPDHNVILDEDLVADVAVLAYDGARQDVCERPRPRCPGRCALPAQRARGGESRRKPECPSHP